MTDLIVAFSIAAATVLLGFFSHSIFRRTNVPDILWLIFLGIVIGPIMGDFLGITIFPENAVRNAIPYIAQLTIALVLFDAGMSLDLTKMAKEGPRGIVFSLLTFLSSMFLVTLTAKIMLNIRWSYSLFLGAILATAGSAVVPSVALRLNLSDETKSVLIIEATMTDIYSLVVGSALLDYMVGQAIEFSQAAKQLVSSISVGLIIGSLIGLLWLYMMEHLFKEEHSYVATLGALIATYALVTWLGGSGAMAALAYGLIIGNYRLLTLILGLETHPFTMMDLTINTRNIHRDITFIVRAFFFVSMGILYIWPTLSEITTIILGILITLILLMTRTLSAYIISNKEMKNEVPLMSFIFGRGLVTALMSGLLISYGVYYSEFINMIVLNTIIVSNLLMTIGVYVYGKRLFKPGIPLEVHKELDFIR